MGYNGQISPGHGAFHAIGAYAAALMVVHGGVPYWLAVPLAGAVGLVAGALFGLPLVGPARREPGADRGWHRVDADIETERGASL